MNGKNWEVCRFVLKRLLFWSILLGFVMVIWPFVIYPSLVHAKNPNVLPQYQNWQQNSTELTNAVPERVIVIRRYVGPPYDTSVIQDVNDTIQTYALGGKAKPSLLVWIRAAVTGEDAIVRLYRAENNAWAFVGAESYSRNAAQVGVSIEVFSPNSEFGKLYYELFCGSGVKKCDAKILTITFR